MKNFLIALSIMILFMTTAYAAQPVRIARLPIIFQGTIPDSETCAALETKIERAVHIPLNGTLKLAEYLPPENSVQVFNELWQELRAADKKLKVREVMRPLAQKLDADIIVCPILKQYSQSIMGSFGWNETFLHSQVRVELIVYDRRSENLIDKKAAQMHHDSYSLNGTASQLSKFCFDRVLDESKLRQLINAIGN